MGKPHAPALLPGPLLPRDKAWPFPECEANIANDKVKADLRVRKEQLALPVVMSDVTLSDQDVAVILDAAKTPSAVVARLRKNPYVAPER